ncbi:MAG: LuxR family transcriptional regulator [Paracoccaceae bacterium]
MDLWSEPSEYNDTDTFASVDTRMTDFVRNLGLEHFSFLFLRGPDHCEKAVETTFRTSYPEEWTTRYASHKYWNLDPVADLGRRAIRPFFWGQGAFLRDFAKSQRLVFDEARVFDIKYGMTIPVRGARGELSVFNVVSSNKAHLQDALRGAHSRIYAAAYDTHEIALDEVLARQNREREGIGLSPREKECLSWTLEGKTAGEIATILGISVSTVNQHASSASNKLGSLNKHHAAVQALRLNLIH